MPTYQYNVFSITFNWDFSAKTYFILTKYIYIYFIEPEKSCSITRFFNKSANISLTGNFAPMMVPVPIKVIAILKIMNFGLRNIILLYITALLGIIHLSEKTFLVLRFIVDFKCG